MAGNDFEGWVVVVPGASTGHCDPNMPWTRTQIDPTVNPWRNYTKKIDPPTGPPTTLTNFSTVGISSRDVTSEYFYLSRLPPNDFCVSSNLFLQGDLATSPFRPMADAMLKREGLRP